MRKFLSGSIVGLALLVMPAWALAQEGAEPVPQPEPATTPAQPTEPAADLPSAEEILKRHVEALGSPEKMKEIKSLRIDGRYVGAPFKFAARLTLWKEAPYQFHLKLVEPAGPTIELGFDKDTGWERQPGVGARYLEGIRLVEMRDTADFWGEANWEDRYLDMKTLGVVQDFNGQKAYAVHVTALSGRQKLLIFSVESGLFLGTRTMTVHPETGEPAEFETVLKPYKEFGGVKIPMGMIQRWVKGAEASVIEYTKVEVNPEEKHDFSPPDDVQAALEPDGDKPGG